MLIESLKYIAYIFDDIFSQIASFCSLQRTRDVVLITIFNSFGKSLHIPGQSCPGTKCSHEEKLSRLGECPCL